MQFPDHLQIRSQEDLIRLSKEGEASPASEMAAKDWDEMRQRLIEKSRVRFSGRNLPGEEDRSSGNDSVR